MDLGDYVHDGFPVIVVPHTVLFGQLGVVGQRLFVYACMCSGAVVLGGEAS